MVSVMNCSRVVVAAITTLTICLTTWTAGAQAADAARDARPQPTINAKPRDAVRDAQPRPGIEAKPTDSTRNAEPRRRGSDGESSKASGRLTVRKILVPSIDSGRFNLIIDAVRTKDGRAIPVRDDELKFSLAATR